MESRSTKIRSLYNTIHFRRHEKGNREVHKYRVRSLRLLEETIARGRAHCYDREIANNILSSAYAPSDRKDTHRYGRDLRKSR